MLVTTRWYGSLGYHGVEYDLVSPEWIIFPMEHPPIGAPIFSTSMFFCDVFVQRIQQKNAVFFWFLMYTGWCFGTMEFYDFPFSWDQLTDFHIFQRGRYTTNQVYFVDQTLEVSAMKLLNLIQHMRRLDTGRLVGTCCVRMSIIGVQWYTYYPLVICYIAIENRPFIWYLPIKDGDFP